jgi:hypothetical protein
MAVAQAGQKRDPGFETAGNLDECRMKTLTAKDTRYGFGRLIGFARAEQPTVAKHGRPVVVVMAVE